MLLPRICIVFITHRKRLSITVISDLILASGIVFLAHICKIPVKLRRTWRLASSTIKVLQHAACFRYFYSHFAVSDQLERSEADSGSSLKPKKWLYPDPDLTPGGTPDKSGWLHCTRIHTIVEERLGNLENKAMKLTISSIFL